MEKIGFDGDDMSAQVSTRNDAMELAWKLAFRYMREKPSKPKKVRVGGKRDSTDADPSLSVLIKKLWGWGYVESAILNVIITITEWERKQAVAFLKKHTGPRKL